MESLDRMGTRNVRGMRTAPLRLPLPTDPAADPVGEADPGAEATSGGAGNGMRSMLLKKSAQEKQAPRSNLCYTKVTLEQYSCSRPVAVGSLT